MDAQYHIKLKGEPSILFLIPKNSTSHRSWETLSSSDFASLDMVRQSYKGSTLRHLNYRRKLCRFILYSKTYAYSMRLHCRNHQVCTAGHDLSQSIYAHCIHRLDFRWLVSFLKRSMFDTDFAYSRTRCRPN